MSETSTIGVGVTYTLKIQDDRGPERTFSVTRADLIAIRSQIDEILGDRDKAPYWPVPRWPGDELIGPGIVTEWPKITYTDNTN